MTLRTKLLLAQTPLVAALLGGGIVAIAFGTSLGHSPRQMLDQNYRSVVAAQQMKQAAGRIERALLLRLSGHRVEPSALANERSAFERALTAQAQNITEAGEAEVTQRLRARWNATGPKLERFATARPGAADKALYADVVAPRLRHLRRDADLLFAMNQEAMLHKSDAAQARASQLRQVILAVLGGGLLLALWGASALTTRLLRPLGVLRQATRRLASGDLAARANLRGHDELAALAAEFNQLAEHLERYRKSSLGELLEAQQAAQATMDSLPDAAIILGVDGGVRGVNRAAEELLSIHLEGPDSLDGLPETLRVVVQRACAHVLEGKGEYVAGGLGEALRLHVRGVEHDLLPRARPVYGVDGALAGATVLLEDVARLVRLEELRTDLVATVAHELRTPLTSLRMAVHLCHDELVGPLNDKQLDLIHTARGDCERLQTIIDELLDLSRIQAGQLVLRSRIVQVDELVTPAIESAAAAAAQGVRLRTEVLPSLGPLTADPERVRLVLDNLLTNALRHSPPDAEVVVRVAPRADALRFEVIDQGPGVPAQYREAIFEKYFQIPGGRGGGSGIGLHIAKEIVLAHGGTLGVDAAPSGGSVFWFELPRAEENKTNA